MEIGDEVWIFLCWTLAYLTSLPEKKDKATLAVFFAF